MGRHVRDPWAKKSQKGMKSLGKMVKIGSALGVAAYKDIKHTNAVARQTNSSELPAAGGVTMVIGLVIAVIVLLSASNFIWGILYAIGILVLTIILAVLATKLSSPSSSKDDKEISDSTVTSKLSQQKPNYDQALTIEEKIIQMAPLDDIDNIIAHIPKLNDQREAMKDALGLALSKISTMPEMPQGIEDYIDSLMHKYSISSNDISHQSSYMEYIKALVVQDILNGVTPSRVSVDVSPINFQPGEVVIWPFNDVVCYEEVTKRTTVGASRGISIRIAKGIYYRVGAFKGEPLITSELQPKYGGSLVLTNKNVYFYSTSKSMKFPYNKVIAFVPFEDGIGIQPDRANAKTIYFKCLDGRFAFNIVSNINNLS